MESLRNSCNGKRARQQIDQLVSTSWQQELHDTAAWFESWMSGTVPETEDSFARLADSMHEDFLLVRDTGRVQNRHQLCDEIRSCHGLRKGRRVWAENEQLRYEDDRTILCTYEEWNDDGHQPHGILAAVTFLKDPDGPNGLRRLHWHETALSAEARPCRELSTEPVGRMLCSIPALHTTDISAATIEKAARSTQSLTCAWALLFICGSSRLTCSIVNLADYWDTPNLFACCGCSLIWIAKPKGKPSQILSIHANRDTP